MPQKRYRRRAAGARSPVQPAQCAETISRLQEFFEVSSAKCSCCDEIGPLPADYGVADDASWERKIDEHLAWARENRKAVLAALPYLPEWRESGRALRQVLESA
jgi:hypothetical protein